MSMTLDEAIKHCEELACNNTKCALEHKQLAEWLSELKKRRNLNFLPEEPVSEGLDEAVKQHSKQTFKWLLIEDNIDAFIAGAEWQKKKMKETLQTEYEKGRFDMREEIMKDAVEGIVQCGWGDGNKLSIKAMLPQDSDLKYADKVKVLILKTEQQ